MIRNQQPPARHFSIAFTLVLLVLVTIFSDPGYTYATTKMLMLNPVRVIFTHRQRAVAVHIINNSDVKTTYSIGLVTMRRDQNGNLQEAVIETEKEKMIKSMIRYSPRRATISPGKRQVVKLMVRKPKDLETGEYKTYLRLSPDQPKSSTNRQPKVDGGKNMVNLDLIVNSAFPIIIQHGEEQSDVIPTSVSLTQFPEAPTGIAAKVTFTREGDFSAFGDVQIWYTSDKSEKARKIGTALGMAIYTPENERTLTIPLTDITQQELSGATIRVSYRPSRGIIEKRRSRKKTGSKEFTLPI